MNARAENMMRACRHFLTVARDFEGAGLMELADAAGAIAANKLAAAIRIDERSRVVVPMERK